MHIKIQMKKKTEDPLDMFQKNLGIKENEETTKKKANPGNFKLIKDLEGIFKGAPPFERDKRDRDFTGHINHNRRARRASG